MQGEVRSVYGVVGVGDGLEDASRYMRSISLIDSPMRAWRERRVANVMADVRGVWGGGRRGDWDASLEGSSESSPGAASGMWAGERRGRGVEWRGGGAHEDMLKRDAKETACQRMSDRVQTEHGQAASGIFTASLPLSALRRVQSRPTPLPSRPRSYPRHPHPSARHSR